MMSRKDSKTNLRLAFFAPDYSGLRDYYFWLKQCFNQDAVKLARRQKRVFFYFYQNFQKLPLLKIIATKARRHKDLFFQT
jgi:hypothetical protein